VETSAASNNAPSPVNVKELAEAVRAAPRTRLGTPFVPYSHGGTV